MSRLLASATAALVAGSCGGGGANSTPTTTGITTVSASESMAGSSSSSSSGSSSGAGAESTRAAETSTSSAPPDLPGFDTLDLPKGCGKIDLLFVVADSGIIDGGEKQEAIEDAQRVRDATNSFVAVMQEQAADYDLQVMVVKGDPSLTPIDADCCAPEKPCDNLAPYPGCGPYEDDPYCDGVLGVGVTFPMGFMASNVRCDLAGGHRYITDGDADFADAFDCLINVGRSGGVQQYAGAMVRAVGPILNGPDGCNAGFVRPDAMLVVVIIANSLDTKSTGNPEGWAASLVAAKGGNAAGIVVVGLLQTYDPFDADDCWDDPDSAVRRMVEDFPTHVLGSYCAPDLGKYLGDAVSVIDAACAEFVPPG